MADLQKWAPAIEVKLNNVAINYLQALEIGRSIGGRSLDYAELEWVRFPRHDAIANVQDTELLANFGQEICTIHFNDETGARRLMHWGVVDCKTISMDRNMRQTITSRIQPYHFGNPIRGMRVWSPFAAAPRDSQEQIVFNPQLDGRVANNLNGRGDPETGSFLFIHPECQRSVEAISIATEGVGVVRGWSLLTACHYLCWSANTAQTLIRNPTLPELAFVLPTDESILRNHQQPFGEYLPANLDALLEPYGYSWKIDLAPGVPKIAVFKRGSGFPISARLADPGEWVDFETSNAEETSITTDRTNRLTNSVEVFGDTRVVEGTWELVRAWGPEYDAVPLTLEGAEKLEIHGGRNKHWDTDPKLARVWRDWVLNEAGDYSAIRGVPPHNFNADAPGEVLVYHARRRRFLPCITLGADGRPIGQHHGVVVEYFHYDRSPTGTDLLTTGTWKPIEHATSADGNTIQVLDKECGIRFSGTHVPPDLIAYGALARVRVTAAVEMDARVSYQANAVSSPNRFRVSRVCDVASRFKQRTVLPISKHAIHIAAGTLGTSATNDALFKTRDFARELLANWNQASISGTIVMPGIDWKIANDCLGRPFDGIDGRNIGFRTTTADPPKFPSVTAVKLDIVNQKTVFSLDTWRRDNA